MFCLESCVQDIPPDTHHQSTIINHFLKNLHKFPCHSWVHCNWTNRVKAKIWKIEWNWEAVAVASHEKTFQEDTRFLLMRCFNVKQMVEVLSVMSDINFVQDDNFFNVVDTFLIYKCLCFCCLEPQSQIGPRLSHRLVDLWWDEPRPQDGQCPLLLHGDTHHCSHIRRLCQATQLCPAGTCCTESYW